MYEEPSGKKILLLFELWYKSRFPEKCHFFFFCCASKKKHKVDKLSKCYTYCSTSVYEQQDYIQQYTRLLIVKKKKSVMRLTKTTTRFFSPCLKIIYYSFGYSYLVLLSTAIAFDVFCSLILININSILLIHCPLTLLRSLINFNKRYCRIIVATFPKCGLCISIVWQRIKMYCFVFTLMHLFVFSYQYTR